MASGFFITVHVNLTRHVKFRNLFRYLNLKTEQEKIFLFGQITLFWCHVSEFYSDGILDDNAISDILDVIQADQNFISGMLNTGFIDRQNNGYIVHDWQEHSGKYHFKLEKDRERKRRFREQKQDVQRTSSGIPADVQQTSSRCPSTREREKEKTREKTREREKEKKDFKDTCSAIQKTESPEPSPDEIHFEIPCLKKQTFKITKTWFAELQSDYPKVDIHQELIKMKNWVLTHNKKSLKGTPGFIVNWLNKANDQLRVTPQAQTQPTQTYTPEPAQQFSKINLIKNDFIDEISKIISREEVYKWFYPCGLSDINNSVITFYAPNRDTAIYLKTNYHQLISDYFKSVTQQKIEVKYVTESHQGRQEQGQGLKIVS